MTEISETLNDEVVERLNIVLGLLPQAVTEALELPCVPPSVSIADTGRTSVGLLNAREDEVPYVLRSQETPFGLAQAEVLIHPRVIVAQYARNFGDVEYSPDNLLNNPRVNVRSLDKDKFTEVLLSLSAIGAALPPMLEQIGMQGDTLTSAQLQQIYNRVRELFVQEASKIE